MNELIIGLFYCGLPLYDNAKQAYAQGTQLIGFPNIDPNEINLYIYNIANNTIDTFNYEVTKQNRKLLLFNSFSAICNGNNSLFISGGEKAGNDPLQPEPLSLFYQISLENSNENNLGLIELQELNVPRTWHSMIFVPPYYVFIVGGAGTKTVELYNTKKGTLEIDSELNEQRSECSLCLVNNTHLYAFYGFLLHHTFVNSIERCNLQRGKRTWEIVNLKCQEDIVPSQSFFSTFLCDDNKVILLGESENEEDQPQNYIMNCGEEESTIAPYNGLDKQFSAIYREKFFIPINNDSAALIPLIVEQVKVILLKNKVDENLNVYECLAKMEEEEEEPQ